MCQYNQGDAIVVAQATNGQRIFSLLGMQGYLDA